MNNEMSPLENRLASWKPLNPSPTLETRIFEAAQPPNPVGIILRNMFWFNDFKHMAMTGASVCLVALVAAAQLGPSLRVDTTNQSRLAPLMCASLSNQSYSSYLNFDHAKLNSWSAPLALTDELATNPAIAPWEAGLSTGVQRTIIP